jgi:hypothetical protein
MQCKSQRPKTAALLCFLPALNTMYNAKAGTQARYFVISLELRSENYPKDAKNSTQCNASRFS